MCYSCRARVWSDDNSDGVAHPLCPYEISQAVKLLTVIAMIHPRQLVALHYYMCTPIITPPVLMASITSLDDN